jgi:hypothetical protein
MGALWYVENCPHCKTENWFYWHRPYDEDCTKSDPEPIYKCRSCLKNFIDDEMDFERHGDFTIFEYSDLWEFVGHDKDKFIEQFEDAELGMEHPRHG